MLERDTIVRLCRGFSRYQVASKERLDKLAKTEASLRKVSDKVLPAVFGTQLASNAKPSYWYFEVVCVGAYGSYESKCLSFCIFMASVFAEGLINPVGIFADCVALDNHD